jgi:hypothetical protein
MTSSPAAFRLTLCGCALIAALALVLSGCGEDGAATPGNTTGQPPEPKTETRASPTGGCPKQLGSFVKSLDALRSRLAVGLAYKQYLAKVKALQATYDQIPVDRLSIDCLTTIGTPGEKALNKHIDAANAWGECLADAACTTATIEPILQRKWRVASRYLSAAR